MRRLESGMSVDNEIFSDIVRYEHETISGTTINNSNVHSPIFWSCHLRHLIFDTCDLTNARFFAGSTIDYCTFNVPICALLGLLEKRLFLRIANSPPVI